MAVPIIYILISLALGHSVKKLLRKHLNIKDVETEMGELFMTIIEARKDNKLTLKEIKEILKKMADVGWAHLLNKIGD
jgi:methyl coenzyme M reductase subunit D